MLARNPSLLFHLGNQVDCDFPIAGVNGAHYTGEFVYTNLEITSHWHVNLDGFMLLGAAVNATPYAIFSSGATRPRFSPWELVSLQVAFKRAATR